MHSRVGQFHLGLDPCDPGNLEVRSLPGAMVQERRLTNSRFTQHDKSRAFAGTDLIQQPPQLVLL
jgi:hypothetical protein